MTTLEIMRSLVQIHNRLIEIRVSGNDTMLMGDSIRELRSLLQELEKDAKAGKETEKSRASDSAIPAGEGVS